MKTAFAMILSLLAGSSLSAKLSHEDRVHAYAMAEKWRDAISAFVGITSGAVIVGTTDASIKGVGRIPVVSAGVALVTLPLYFCAVKEYKRWSARAYKLL